MSKKSQDPQNIVINNKPLVCPICGNDQFRHRRILLNTRAYAVFDIEWANKRANCYVCSNCRYMYWFHE